jgi:hypothetical protein
LGKLGATLNPGFDLCTECRATLSHQITSASELRNKKLTWISRISVDGFGCLLGKEGMLISLEA